MVAPDGPLPSYPQPAPTTRVWRYMDLRKFIWLLDNRKLYLRRLDLLQDAREGSLPRPTRQGYQRFQELHGSEGSAATLTELWKQNRRSLYVNCWCMGDHESEAMWRLYCPDGRGVAIRTTYGKLLQGILGKFDVAGSVTYISYESGGFSDPFANAFHPAMHKSVEFKHENEVRIVKTLHEYAPIGAPESPSHTTLDCDIEALVQDTRISPYASEDCLEEATAAVRRFAPSLEEGIAWSRMKAAPEF